jgi:fatty acid synthase subunit alpha, fungi type
VLLTGAGPSSIGIAMLPLLLQGGAKVAVTTTRPMSEAGPIYQMIFAAH